MSKKKNKKHRQRLRKQKSRLSGLNISHIDQHKRDGNKLRPPFTQLPLMTPSSWADDHMPEMLWAVLLTGVFNRKDYLNCLRALAILCCEWFVKDESTEEKLAKPDPEAGINFGIVVDQTKLAEISDAQFEQFVAIILKHPLGYAALRPLLLVESLPGLERWKKSLGVEAASDDWHTLGTAVAGVLDHQSEASTDIRWFKVILPIISGRMFYPESMAERLEELRLFPDKGDMRSVRPHIRSSEMLLRRNPPSAWIQEFWAELLKRTRCIDPSSEGYSFVDTVINPKPLYAARYQVIQRFKENITAKRADARLDSAFGLVLYGLSIVEELGFHRIHVRITGRLALRALVEANITLRYLAQKDDEKLWKSYRVYGAGQAKLAFLKAQEVEGDLPPFIDEEALHQIANEDAWQEFLDIDIGHWANSNLRKLAIECGAKDLYDKYYDWASTYAHSHWGAIRDTNFITCHNPLHRLHRIPRLDHRTLNSVEGDAIELVNQMLEFLDGLYAGENAFGKLSLMTEAEAKAEGDSAVAVAEEPGDSTPSASA
jgi:hypothetical protein